MNWLRDARVVPWSSWDEWGALRTVLANDVGNATQVAAVWRLRRASRMPVAMQADVSMRVLLAQERSYEWRLATAMTLVRVVNGLTDRLQPTATRARARSVKALADSLALPPLLVNVRHQASHNALPGANALESAAKMAVQWIETQYWQPQQVAAMTAQVTRTVAQLNAVFEGASGIVARDDDDDDDKAVTKGDALNFMLDAIESAKTAAQAPRLQTSGRKRWRKCETSDKWARMPLGLCPWQTTVDAGLFGGAFDEDEVGSKEIEKARKDAREIEMEPSALEDDKMHSAKRRRIEKPQLEYIRNMRANFIKERDD